MVKKPKRKTMKKLFSTLLAATLLLGGLGIQGSDKATASGYRTIVNVEEFENYAHLAANRALDHTFTFSDGTKLTRAITNSSPDDITRYIDTTGIKKVYMNEPANGGLSGAGVYLTESGDLMAKYKNDASHKLMDTGVKDFHITARNFDTALGVSTVYIKEDGTVYAYGYGSDGNLGIGVKADKTTPTPVVDPNSVYGDDPLTGIKKLIVLQGYNYGALLLVGDGEVYLIGNAFGHITGTSGKPVDITSFFPQFSQADDFNYGYLGNENLMLTSGNVTRIRYFDINGIIYTLQDMTGYYPYMAGGATQELNATRLYEYTHGDPLNLQRVHTFTTTAGYSAEKRVYDTYISLGSDGTLYTRDGDPLEMGKARTKIHNNKVAFMTGVKQFTIAGTTVVAVRDNKQVYLYGTNATNMFGIYGAISTPTRYQGSGNELQDVKKVEGYNVLLENGELYNIASATTTKYPGEYLDLFTLHSSNYYSPSLSMLKYQYAITTDGELYWLESSASRKKIADNVYPQGYTPADSVEKPTADLSKDAFDNTVVTLTYPATATKQEYSLDGGNTWMDYTAPVTLTGTGTVELQARAGTDTAYSDVLIVTAVNNPIDIPAGYPKILENDGKVTIDLGTIPQDRVDVVVIIDGSEVSYTGPVDLADGTHTVEVIVKNKNGDELTTVTETVVVDTVGNVGLTAPTAATGSLNGNNQMPITVKFDPQQGSLQVKKVTGSDLSNPALNGQWVDESDILNVYYGDVSDNSATERQYTLLVDNEASQYAFRITDGNINSAETLVTLSMLVLDPTFVREVDDKLAIDFSNLPAGSYKKEYSLDSGVTYVEYTDSFDVGEGLPIHVRVTDNTTGTVVLDKAYVTPPLNSTGGGTNPNPPNGGGNVDPTWGTEITSGSQDADLTIIGGGLSSKFYGLLLDNIDISTVADYQVINSVTSTEIEDSRGTGGGWSYSLAITDFVSDPVLDTGINEQNLIVKIPASAMNVDVRGSRTLAGMPDNVSKTQRFVLGETAQELAGAEKEHGMGFYSIPMDYMFRVPSRVEVVEAAPHSAYRPGDTVGLRVGTYRSVFSFSLVAGI